MNQHREMTPTLVPEIITHRRSNQQWITELRDQADPRNQHKALDDLSRYLYVVAYNTLQRRRKQFSKLQEMDNESLEELVQDFVQDVILKLSCQDFGLLCQFQGKGRFTSWVAQIINNEIASEFRKVHWVRVQRLSPSHENQLSETNGSSPEAIAINSCLYATLDEIVSELPPKLQVPLIRCVMHNERAAVVATDMGITSNTVYSLVHRGKKILQDKLEMAGYSSF